MANWLFKLFVSCSQIMSKIKAILKTIHGNFVLAVCKSKYKREFLAMNDN